MKVQMRWITSPSRCGYLPDRLCKTESVIVSQLDANEYSARLLTGWRRFGRTLFRPRCSGCFECRSLRIDVNRFHPDRIQRRTRRANEGVVRLDIGEPKVSPEKLALLDRFHAFRTQTRGWPQHEAGDVLDYLSNFVDNPFPTQEWSYRLGEDLVGLGYVDQLPAGLSAIYYFHDPAHAARSLGTWNVLSLLERSTALELPYLYLGYYVEGCPSMQYKSRFRPYQTLEADGSWHDQAGAD